VGGQRQVQGDGPAERVPDDGQRAEAQLVEGVEDVGDVLLDAPRRRPR